MHLAIAFECQLELPPSPLKKNIFNLEDCLNPALWIAPLPSGFTTLGDIFLQYKSSIICVLSTMHISKMVLKRKKAYKPKGGERGRGWVRIWVPIQMYLYEH